MRNGEKDKSSDKAEILINLDIFLFQSLQTM